MRAGTISPTAFRKFISRTSQDGQSLSAHEGVQRDDSGSAFQTDHINQNQRGGPGLGDILKNPSADYGAGDAAGRNDIDKRANKRGDRESKYSKQRTHLDKPLNASAARVRAASAHEHYDSAWYGTPARRQGG